MRGCDHRHAGTGHEPERAVLATYRARVAPPVDDAAQAVRHVVERVLDLMRRVGGHAIDFLAGEADEAGAGVHAHPEPARGIFDDRRHDALGKAILPAHGREAVAVEPAQPRCQADPDRVALILVDGHDGAARQAIALAERTEAAVFVDRDTASGEPEPDAPVAVAERKRAGAASDLGDVFEAVEKPPVEACHPLGSRAEPDAALGVGGQRRQQFEPERAWEPDLFEAAVDNAAEPLVRGGPHLTARVGVQRHRLGDGQRLMASAREDVDVVSGRHPDAAVHAGGQGAHAVVGQPIERQIGADDGFGESQRHPEIAVAVLIERLR
jgi:hypothetical protein